MNGIELRALLAAAGLRDPDAAADYLKVAPVTLWRWCYDAQPIPAWAVEQLRARVAELVGPAPERKD